MSGDECAFGRLLVIRNYSELAPNDDYCSREALIYSLYEIGYFSMLIIYQ